MTNCSCKRIVKPWGTWELDQLLGAHVKILSMPVSNFYALDSDQDYTIKNIIFRVTETGKAITIIILDQLPDLFFTWKDLEICGIYVKESDEGESDTP